MKHLLCYSRNGQRKRAMRVRYSLRYRVKVAADRKITNGAMMRERAIVREAAGAPRSSPT